MTPIELEKKLDTLIHQSDVVLFIKGDPEFPKCGFSARAVEILVDNDIVFSSFDILTDEEVRQGLKVYKNWPTYPQLYIKGEMTLPEAEPSGYRKVTRISSSVTQKSSYIPSLSPVFEHILL